MRVLACLVAAATLLGARPSRASGLCTLGSVKALSQMLPVAGQVISPRSGRRARLAEARGACQYRLFADGATFEFDTGDFILGGITWLDPIAADFPREAGIADIEQIADRLQIAPIDADGTLLGPLVDQPLAITAFKNVVTASGDTLLYQQRYFIAQLPPGDYISIWTSTYAGEDNGTATVYLHVGP